MSIGVAGTPWGFWADLCCLVRLHHQCLTDRGICSGVAHSLLLFFSEVALVLLISANKRADNRSPECSQKSNACLGGS